MDEYYFPADKQTYKTKHKQTNKQKIMQYTQNISYLIRIKRPNHVKKIVMKDFITCLLSFLFPFFFFDPVSLTVMIFCWSVPPTSKLP